NADDLSTMVVARGPMTLIRFALAEVEATEARTPCAIKLSVAPGDALLDAGWAGRLRLAATSSAAGGSLTVWLARLGMRGGAGGMRAELCVGSARMPFGQLQVAMRGEGAAEIVLTMAGRRPGEAGDALAAASPDDEVALELRLAEP